MLSEQLQNLLKTHTVVPYRGKFPERMLQWADALESGEYEQTKYCLRNGTGYCCLGVACDISGVHVWNKEHNLILSGAVTDWLDVYGFDPPILESSFFTLRFSALNDMYDCTFEDIAYLIRESVKCSQ